MARLFFNRGAAKAGADQSSTLREKVRVLAALGDDDGVSVTEIACSHPDCGEGETVILIMRVGRKTEAVKIMKAVALIDDADVIEALKGQGG